MFGEVQVQKSKSISIHPGVVDGRRAFPLKHTCKPSKKNGRCYARVIKRYDQRLSDHALTLKSLPSSVNPLAFKKPGSRNPTKLRQR